MRANPFLSEDHDANHRLASDEINGNEQELGNTPDRVRSEDFDWKFVTESNLDLQYKALFAQVSARSGLVDTGPAVSFAKEAIGAGRADLAVNLLVAWQPMAPSDANFWHILGIAYRDLQRMEEALAALEKAHTLAPEAASIALGHVQLLLETGRPSAALFQEALKRNPADLRVIKSLAIALSAEGDSAAAQTLLTQTLAAHPDWIDGHRQLTNLEATSVDGGHFAASYERACAAMPDHLQLRLAWFQAMASAKKWDEARAIIAEGERLMGARPGFAAAKVFIAAESGEAAGDAALFEPVAHFLDPGLDLCQVRHALRRGDFGIAEDVCNRNLHGPAANNFWPYLSLIWRLTGNPRAAWLDGAPPYIQAFDLDFTSEELAELADLLRSLHTMEAPYLEQSVRGGTQTDRPLLFRNEPIIQSAKRKILEAVTAYVSALPSADSAHPLLGPPRGPILFEGSWSVRLHGQGFHACHTHPMGWISSALYVSLPAPADLGPEPSGWLSFGTPPPELNLGLQPYHLVKPVPGRLVLFPSTMWHSTVPLSGGERLTIAFDVRRPR